MDYEALDGALMVYVAESDHGEMLIVTWHGANQLNLHDDTLQVYETRNIEAGIRDPKEARNIARDWVADIIVENDKEHDRMYEDDGA